MEFFSLNSSGAKSVYLTTLLFTASSKNASFRHPNLSALPADFQNLMF